MYGCDFYLKGEMTLSVPILFQKTEIYEFNDSDPIPIVVDEHFYRLTVTTQPLNIPVGDEDKPLSEIFIETNAVLKNSVSGTVQLSASPPRSFEFYDIPEGLIDLSTPSFINTETPIWKLTPVFTGVTGATHVAVTVSGFE